MRRALLAAALTCGSATGGDAPPRLQLRVDGVAMELRHARGDAALRLAAEESARLQGGDLAARPWLHEVPPWQVLTQIRAHRSISVQTRGAGATAETLVSVLDLDDLRAPAPPPVWLPGTDVLRTVETLGEAPSTQWTLRTTWSARAALRLLRTGAPLQGWQVAESSGQGLRLRRLGADLQVTALAPPPGAHGTTLLLTRWGP